MRKNIQLLVCLICLLSFGRQAMGQTHWTCDIRAFQYDMTMYFTPYVDGKALTSLDGYELAAFCADECRGVASMVTVAGTDVVYGYIRIRSNVESGDSITFKLYDTTSGEETTSSTSVKFASMSAIGTPSNTEGMFFGPNNFFVVDKNGNNIKESVSTDDDVTIYDVYKSLFITDNVKDVNITYSRTFKNANWQPLYVPFDMTVSSDLLQRFSFAKFAGTYTEQDNAGNVSFFITIVRLLEGDKIKANTPYFIQAKTADASNAQTISVDGTTLHKTEEMNFSMYSAEKKLSVYGIYNQKICAYDGEYYAYSAGKYSRQLTGAKLGAFRFYVTIENREDNPYGTSSPAEIKLKVVGDDATGISDANVDADADVNGNCFNLAGQVVGPDYKGIVIKNGKKMYNK